MIFGIFISSSKLLSHRKYPRTLKSSSTMPFEYSKIVAIFSAVRSVATNEGENEIYMRQKLFFSAENCEHVRRSATVLLGRYSVCLFEKVKFRYLFYYNAFSIWICNPNIYLDKSLLSVILISFALVRRLYNINHMTNISFDCLQL